MTAIQMNAMNAEVWRNIGAIADNEELMRIWPATPTAWCKSSRATPR